MFEERWSQFEQAERSALFASGMAAITTSLLTLCRPGDHILYSAPVYGGTDYLMKHLLPSFGIQTTAFLVTDGFEQMRA
ncbi:MAG: PLP-dependent transferase, partial [Patescibacteria group bacterium]